MWWIFFGDKSSLINFYNVSIDHYSTFLELTQNVVWEVNYWSWLEAKKYFNPIWYPADHNDSIIELPNIIFKNYKVKLEDIYTLIFLYPELNNEITKGEKFYPSSSSYIFDKKANKHILNIRYVNYYYLDNWECVFKDNNRQIKTYNVQSELDNSKNYFQPFSFKIMTNEDSNFNSNPNALSQGLEDIRLYEDNGDIKFIATNLNYIPCGHNRMIIGDYDYENNICKNLQIINMTWDSHCEKNWSPLPCYINNKKLFVYKWSPYSVGFVNSENNFELCIEKQFENEKIKKFRGSTQFLDYNEEYYIGLVHYSDQTVPPIYYNTLVLINKNTNLPEFYSDEFKFSNQPIEFCIGFTIEESNYVFWVSQMDREPICVKVKKDIIKILNKLN